MQINISKLKSGEKVGRVKVAKAPAVRDDSDSYELFSGEVKRKRPSAALRQYPVPAGEHEWEMFRTLAKAKGLSVAEACEEAVGNWIDGRRVAKTSHANVRISAARYAQVESRSDDEGITVMAYIRRAIREWIMRG